MVAALLSVMYWAARAIVLESFALVGAGDIDAVLSALLAALVTVGLACGGGLFILLEFALLRPLARLHRDVEAIGDSGDFSRRVRVQGRDELAHLGRRINATLETLEQARDDLRQANASLETSLARSEAEQARREHFYTNAAYELRAPLSKLRARLFLIMHHPDALREHLETISSTVNEMNALVEELVDVSRLERGAVRLDMEMAVLQSVLQEALLLQAGTAARRGVTLTHEFTAQPLRVSVDAKRLMLALAHVLGSAINHSPPDTTVWLTLRSDERHAHIRIEAREITPGESERSLQSSVPQPESDPLGSRLRLTIAREVVEMHGGSISATSDDERAVWSIRLPLLSVARRRTDTVPAVRVGV
jgi:signal transduction histidine kinase